MQYKDGESFYKEAVRLYHEWKKSLPSDDSVDMPEEVSTAKTAAITFEEAEEVSWGEIEQFLAGMKPYDYQDLVGALLRGLGYHVVWTAPPGKDGGVDILAWIDALGTQSPCLKVQVKRQSSSAITVDGLRSFLAQLGDASRLVSFGGGLQGGRPRKLTGKVALQARHGVGVPDALQHLAQVRCRQCGGRGLLRTRGWCVLLLVTLRP